jgi:hypothetical protein
MTSKNDIYIAIKGAVADVESAIYEITDQQFFSKPENDKWSIAENIQHLILSVNPVNLALSMPLILLKVFGNSKHHRSYDDIIALYQQKLGEGAKASLPFIPRKIMMENDKSMLITTFSKAYNKLNNLFTELTEDQLDDYSLPHPILGKLSIREMLYFTLYHIRHHHATIKKLI